MDTKTDSVFLCVNEKAWDVYLSSVQLALPPFFANIAGTPYRSARSTAMAIPLVSIVRIFSLLHL